MRRKQPFLCSLACTLVLALTLIMTGCGPAAPAPATKPAPTPAPAPSPAPAPAPAPAPKPAPAAATQWPDVVSIGTSGPSGGTSPVFCLTWATVLSKVVGHRISAEPTGGSSATVAMMQKGQLPLGFTNSQDAYLGARGAEYFKQVGKVDMRMLMVAYDSKWGLWARAGVGIKEVPDLKGRRCFFNLQGSALTADVARIHLEAYGMTFNDVKVIDWSSWNEIKQAVAEGRADAGTAVCTGDAPHPSIYEIAMTTDLIPHMPLSQQAQEAIVQKYTYWSPGLIRKGTYRNQDSDLRCVSLPYVFTSRADLSDEVAYALVKATWTNLNDLGVANAAFKSCPPEGATRLWIVPYHPGAVKYYKEAGMWTPEMDAKQAKLLITRRAEFHGQSPWVNEQAAI